MSTLKNLVHQTRVAARCFGSGVLLGNPNDVMFLLTNALEETYDWIQTNPFPGEIQARLLVRLVNKGLIQLARLVERAGQVEAMREMVNEQAEREHQLQSKEPSAGGTKRKRGGGGGSGGGDGGGGSGGGGGGGGGVEPLPPLPMEDEDENESKDEKDNKESTALQLVTDVEQMRRHRVSQQWRDFFVNNRDVMPLVAAFLNTGSVITALPHLAMRRSLMPSPRPSKVFEADIAMQIPLHYLWTAELDHSIMSTSWKFGAVLEISEISTISKKPKEPFEQKSVTHYTVRQGNDIMWVSKSWVTPRKLPLWCHVFANFIVGRAQPAPFENQRIQANDVLCVVDTEKLMYCLAHTWQFPTGWEKDLTLCSQTQVRPVPVVDLFKALCDALFGFRKVTFVINDQSFDSLFGADAISFAKDSISRNLSTYIHPFDRVMATGQVERILQYQRGFHKFRYSQLMPSVLKGFLGILRWDRYIGSQCVSPLVHVLDVEGKLQYFDHFRLFGRRMALGTPPAIPLYDDPFALAYAALAVGFLKSEAELKETGNGVDKVAVFFKYAALMSKPLVKQLITVLLSNGLSALSILHHPHFDSFAKRLEEIELTYRKYTYDDAVVQQAFPFSILTNPIVLQLIQSNVAAISGLESDPDVDRRILIVLVNLRKIAACVTCFGLERFLVTSPFLIHVSQGIFVKTFRALAEWITKRSSITTYDDNPAIDYIGPLWGPLNPMVDKAMQRECPAFFTAESLKRPVWQLYRLLYNALDWKDLATIVLDTRQDTLDPTLWNQYAEKEPSITEIYQKMIAQDGIADKQARWWPPERLGLWWTKRWVWNPQKETAPGWKLGEKLTRGWLLHTFALDISVENDDQDRSANSPFRILCKKNMWEPLMAFVNYNCTRRHETDPNAFALAMLRECRMLCFDEDTKSAVSFQTGQIRAWFDRYEARESLHYLAAWIAMWILPKQERSRPGEQYKFFGPTESKGIVDDRQNADPLPMELKRESKPDEPDMYKRPFAHAHSFQPTQKRDTRILGTNVFYNALRTVDSSCFRWFALGMNSTIRYFYPPLQGDLPLKYVPPDDDERTPHARQMLIWESMAIFLATYFAFLHEKGIETSRAMEHITARLFKDAGVRWVVSGSTVLRDYFESINVLRNGEWQGVKPFLLWFTIEQENDHKTIDFLYRLVSIFCSGNPMQGAEILVYILKYIDYKNENVTMDKVTTISIIEFEIIQTYIRPNPIRDVNAATTMVQNAIDKLSRDIDAKNAPKPEQFTPPSHGFSGGRFSGGPATGGSLEESRRSDPEWTKNALQQMEEEMLEAEEELRQSEEAEKDRNMSKETISQKAEDAKQHLMDLPEFRTAANALQGPVSNELCIAFWYYFFLVQGDDKTSLAFVPNFSGGSNWLLRMMASNFVREREEKSESLENGLPVTQDVKVLDQWTDDDYKMLFWLHNTQPLDDTHTVVVESLRLNNSGTDNVQLVGISNAAAAYDTNGETIYTQEFNLVVPRYDRVQPVENPIDQPPPPRDSGSAIAMADDRNVVETIQRLQQAFESKEPFSTPVQTSIEQEEMQIQTQGDTSRQGGDLNRQGGDLRFLSARRVRGERS